MKLPADYARENRPTQILPVRAALDRSRRWKPAILFELRPARRFSELQAAKNQVHKRLTGAQPADDIVSAPFIRTTA
jgi:hypothetical protein